MTTRRFILALPLIGLVSACASLPGHDPLQINVAGIEAMPGQGLELRLLVKLRVLNPNDTPVQYDGIFLEMDVRGGPFASGVSDAKGSLARYSEVVLAVPVTVSAMSLLRQALNTNGGADTTALSYRMKGKIGGGAFGANRFESSGDLSLPNGPAAASTRRP